MNQDNFVFRVIHCIKNLFRRQAPVLRVQHRPHHGNGEEALQIAMAVIIEDADDISLPDA